MNNKLPINKLSVKNLSKKYGKRLVIQDVSFDIKQGEIVGILGPNGAGKTTSFYMVTGLIFPNSGKIYMNDNDITHLPIYERAKIGIGYLPQEASIFRGMNVEENIMAILELKYKNKDEIKHKLEELLNQFNITHIRKSSALSLSGGERRRVEIARSLAIDPSFILLDEPFAGVDPIAVRDIRELILELKRNNIGVLITDHNVRETLKTVDRAYIIYDGRVLISGTKEDIINSEEARRIYLGDEFIV